MSSAKALGLRKALATNSAAANYTALVVTQTEPTGDGVFRLSDSRYGLGTDGRCPKWVQLIPFGGNDDGDVFTFRLWGWSKIELLAPSAAIYVPQLLVELTATLSSTCTATPIAASMLQADTLAIVGTSGATDEKTLGLSIITPANDTPASALVHIRGCEYLQFDFKKGAGADAMNCLWRGYDQI